MGPVTLLTLSIITMEFTMSNATAIITSFVPAVSVTTANTNGVSDMHTLITAMNMTQTTKTWVQTEESKEFSKEFFRKMKDKMKTDKEDVALDKIELFSSKMIATQFAYAMEKAAFFTQYLPEDYSKYVFTCVDSSFDYRRIALWAVQVARILPWLHTPYNFTMVCEVSQFHQHIQKIERANQSIFNDYVGDKAASNRSIWADKMAHLLDLCVLAGLCEFVDVSGVKCIVTTQKYNNVCVDSRALMHSTERFTELNRTRSMIKGLQGKREKQALSHDVRNAIQFIQDQPQMVNRDLLEAVVGFNNKLKEMGYDDKTLPQFVRDCEHVINGCEALKDHDQLFAQYFMDNRGRQYQSQHCGPNPQAGDLSKALCFHTVENIVVTGSAQYDMFINEMVNEIVDGAEGPWMEEATIRYVAAKPMQSLLRAFQLTQGKIHAAAQANGTTYEQEAEFFNYGLPFKKFFTYMTMCKDWVAFQDNGQADVRLGFGPDCKSSGAQILAILAGAKEAAEACGLITNFTKKPADLYQVSANMVNLLVQSHKELSLHNIEQMTRNGIKRAFMAIQYGGGVPAITSGQDLRTYARMGVPSDLYAKYAELIIEAILKAMGEEIESFIEGLRNAVAARCSALSAKTGKPVYSFEYQHLDGFKCTKKGEAEVMMTEQPFIISLGDTNKAGIIFGAITADEQTGWNIPSNTQGALQLQNFIHFFPVHFIQGLDAVMSRKIALESKKQGLRGYTCIHDQFRGCLEDALMLRDSIIPAVYKDMFIDNNIVAHLSSQIGDISWGHPLEAKVNPVTEEILFSTDAYYFG